MNWINDRSMAECKLYWKVVKKSEKSVKAFIHLRIMKCDWHTGYAKHTAKISLKDGGSGLLIHLWKSLIPFGWSTSISTQHLPLYHQNGAKVADYFLAFGLITSQSFVPNNFDLKRIHSQSEPEASFTKIQNPFWSIS